MGFHRKPPICRLAYTKTKHFEIRQKEISENATKNLISSMKNSTFSLILTKHKQINEQKLFEYLFSLLYIENE